MSKCKCHAESDRQKLLSIVQQGFGDFESFNAIIREVPVVAHLVAPVVLLHRMEVPQRIEVGIGFQHHQASFSELATS